MLTHYYEQLAQAQGRGDNITVTTLQDLFYQVVICLFIDIQTWLAVLLIDTIITCSSYHNERVGNKDFSYCN